MCVYRCFGLQALLYKIEKCFQGVLDTKIEQLYISLLQRYVVINYCNYENVYTVERMQSSLCTAII